MVQYRTRPTKTLNYLVYYIENFQATMDIVTTDWKSEATDSIAHPHMKDLKMQLKAERAIKDEERVQHRAGRSCTQMKHQKAEHKKHLQEVAISTIHECTSFNFVNNHLTLHYEESVQCVGHLVKDSTQTHEMNNSKMCMGLYHWANGSIRYAQQILNDSSCILLLWILYLHLPMLGKAGHWAPEAQEALQLYWPKDQIVVNKYNSE